MSGPLRTAPASTVAERWTATSCVTTNAPKDRSENIARTMLDDCAVSSHGARLLQRLRALPGKVVTNREISNGEDMKGKRLTLRISRRRTGRPHSGTNAAT